MRRTCSWLLAARKLGSPNFFPVSVSTSLSMVDKRLMIMIRSWSWCWWWVWGQLGQGIFKVWLSLGKNTCPLYKNSPWPWSHCNMIPSRVVKRWTHQVAEGKSASMNKSKQQGRASLYNSVHLSRSIWQELVSERRSTRQMFLCFFTHLCPVAFFSISTLSAFLLFTWLVTRKTSSWSTRSLPTLTWAILLAAKMSFTSFFHTLFL